MEVKCLNSRLIHFRLQSSDEAIFGGKAKIGKHSLEVLQIKRL